MTDVVYGGGWDNHLYERMSPAVQRRVMTDDAAYEAEGAKQRREREEWAQRMQNEAIQASFTLTETLGQPVIATRQTLSQGVGHTKSEFVSLISAGMAVADAHERARIKRSGMEPEDLMEPMETVSPNAKLYAEAGADLGKRMTSEERDHIRSATGWDPVTRTSDYRSYYAAERASESLSASRASGDAAIRRQALTSESRMRAIASEVAAKGDEKVSDQARKDAGMVARFTARFLNGGY